MLETASNPRQTDKQKREQEPELEVVLPEPVDPDLPQAPSIDLGEPVVTPEPDSTPQRAAADAKDDSKQKEATPDAPGSEILTPEAIPTKTIPTETMSPETADTGTDNETTSSAATPDDTDPLSPPKTEKIAVQDATTDTAPINQVLVLLGTAVPPGTSTRLPWAPAQSLQGIAVPTPVLVVNGVRPGPVICLTAAIHGDELNGIEIIRRVLYNLDPEKLAGAVIGVPIVNLQAFRNGSRYLPDRRDLNRFFPGNPHGSSASRIAHSFFTEVIGHCSALIDLHTGSFHRTNLPQLRADLTKPNVADLTKGFGATVVLHSTGTKGTLRFAANDAGIPAVTLEAGEPMRLQEDAVSHGVKGIQSLLNRLEMYKRKSFWGTPEPIYYQSAWVRADKGGILLSAVKLGEKVRPGQLLGTITDPITNVRSELASPFSGRVLGMALNQVVMPGFATYRIGIQTNEEDIQPAAIQNTQAESMASVDPELTDSTPSATDTGKSAPTPNPDPVAGAVTQEDSSLEPEVQDDEE